MRVNTTDGRVVDLAEEYPRTARRLEELEKVGAGTDLAGETLEAGPFLYELERDPQGELKEALLDAQGQDPAPEVGDEELYRRWKEAHHG